MDDLQSVDPIDAEVSDIWRTARDLIRSNAQKWRNGRRLTRSSRDYVEPRPFCDDVLARALSDRQFLNTKTRAAFFDWSCTEPRPKVFLLIVAAHDLLSRGDKSRSLKLLDRALTLDQEDIYAQELWFAARGDPVQPVDPTTHFCPNPFERIESASRNRVMFCCPAWLPSPVGSLEDDTVEAVWNSQTAQDIRASIHDGSYRYCSRMHCPMFTEKALPKIENLSSNRLKTIAKTKATVLPAEINRINLAHDRSCNLSCPSCRTKLIIADGAETARLDAFTDKALLPLIMASRRVGVTGSGDPFSSKHYRNVIRRLTKLPHGPVIDLQTNGLMLERSWDDLGLEGRVGNVLLSIDAAQKETYETIRRGGLFEDLLENLAFLGKLKQRGAVQYARLDFVTQALNFREMPAAADLMRSFGLDAIKFQMLRSWNTWSAEEFEKHHVGHPGHPDYSELQNVLADSRLAQPDVYLSGFYTSSPKRSSSSARSAAKSDCSKGDARQSAKSA